MFKTSGETLATIKSEIEKEERKISLLEKAFESFQELDGKQFNKNITHISRPDNIRIYLDVVNYYSSSVLYIFSNNFKACETWMNVKKSDIAIIPEGKKKEFFKADILINDINDTIQKKNERIKKLKQIDIKKIISVFDEMNEKMKTLTEITENNEELLSLANFKTLDYEIRNDRFKIDIDDYKPLQDYKRVIEENTKALTFSEQLAIEKDIENILNNGGWLESTTLKLMNHYGYTLAGDKNYMTIYPHCEDGAGVIPSINVSINRGHLV